MSETLKDLDLELKSLYIDFRQKHAELSILNNQIKELEDKRSVVMEKDGRKFAFSKPVVILRSMTTGLKIYDWIEVKYEGFEKDKLNPRITDEALIGSVYFYQSNYSAKANMIIIMDGYLNEEEYSQIRKELGDKYLPEYYKEGK